MKDLRQGRLDVDPHYFQVDLPYYREHLQSFLPERVIDIHAHVGYRRGRCRSDDPQPTFWPQWITMGADMTVPHLLDAYLKLLPGKQVDVLCFGSPVSAYLEQLNSYLAGELRSYPNVWGLALTRPTWDQDTLFQRVDGYGFRGMKSYQSLVENTPADDVTILQIYPHHQLELAEEQGWVVMLHLPRAERIADPINIRQLHEIAAAYPTLKLIIAHVGRAYAPRFADQGLEALRDLPSLYYDISANTCQPVFERLIETVGPKRILYGSDLPIFAARGRRVWEGDAYINYIYQADWSDQHTRRRPEEEETYTFLLYEEIMAFKQAALRQGLNQQDIADVFCSNALRLLGEQGDRTGAANP